MNADGCDVQAGHELGPAEPDRRVGYDDVDSMPMAVLPREVQAAAAPTLISATTEIARQGARGEACRRLMARTVVLARVELRYRQSLLNVVLEKYASGRGSERQVRTLEKLVAGAHRRLIEAVDCLNRLGAASVALQINAVHADVSVVSGGTR